MTDANETPCLVDTARGVSVLYHNRYLFSKYDPQKAFKTVLENTTILPESLIVCVSPVLAFPIQEIMKKLENEKIDSCFVLAIEKDKTLYDFFYAQYQSDVASTFSSILVEHVNDIALLLEGMNLSGIKIPSVSRFRRIIVLDASGAVQQHKDFYNEVIMYAQNSISQFWKNRMTLLSLGKLFSKNTIKNVSKLRTAFSIQKQSISKPILVVGAGSSLDEVLPFIKKNNRSLYIISIGASVRTLIASGIEVDCVINIEAQFATEKAFVGIKNSKICLFTDIASRPSVTNLLGGNVGFFMSEYAASPLLERVKQFFPHIPVFPPLGSVGISAVELALFMRKDIDVPVFFTGLDFSFPVGKTHAKESPHIKESLQNCNRLSPVGNVAVSFRPGVFSFRSQNKDLVSDSGLKVYADLFNERYKNVKNIFNISRFGMLDSHFNCNLETALKILSSIVLQDMSSVYSQVDNCSSSVKKFYKEEQEKLMSIKNMLTGKTLLDESTLLPLLEDCSYLYDHFPDGHKGANLRQDFLNRVRSEVDVFLKQLTITM